MTRTGQAAIDYARSRVGGSMSAEGLCLQFVRVCFDVASYYYSALDAWNGSPTQHPGDRNPPAAVPVYFRTPSEYDHVAFYVGPHEVISTWGAGIKTFDGIGGIEANFGGGPNSYLGWCEDINRVTVYTGDAASGGDDWLSYLNYDEQRRVLQAADSWNLWGPGMKTNNDRLPHIHATVDTINAGVGNVTNGVLELLDALHELQNAVATVESRILGVFGHREDDEPRHHGD